MNTRQITKAMELVAASKMRKAQEYALAGRTYREFAYFAGRNQLHSLSYLPRVFD